MHLQENFLKFIETYLPHRPPVLLGFSGGPDSTALFHLLLAAKYPFEAAHVDHGWRRESGEESAILAHICAEQGISFHLNKMPTSDVLSNLEDKGRKFRLNFFKEITKARQLHGVLLAHHADDQAETILKRLFEGASLNKLKGLTSKKEMKDLILYRPLLSQKKKDIILWLNERGIGFFNDPTNADPRFLRSRLREDLIPSLSQHFGKEISLNLCRLGASAEELDLFLQELSLPYLAKVEKNAGEIFLDFSTQPPPNIFLWKAILREFFSRQNISLSHKQVESLLLHLQKGSCHKYLKIGKEEICIHRKRLSIKQKSYYKAVDQER